MDPLVQVAIVSGAVAVVCAWISRPTVMQQRRLKRIEEHTEKTGNGFAQHVLDALGDIKGSQAHLIGRFDQHLEDADKDEKHRREESIRMWRAIEAVANATPEGDRDYE